MRIVKKQYVENQAKTQRFGKGGREAETTIFGSVVQAKRILE